MTTVDQVNNDKSIKFFMNTTNKKKISRMKLSDLALEKYIMFQRSMSVDLALIRTDEFLGSWVPV